MLGAMEAKVVTRMAADHFGEWRPVHAAVIDFLFSHFNSDSRQCNPSKNTIAGHCGCSVKTVDRVVKQLNIWGYLRWEKGGMKARGLKISNRYEVILPSATNETLPSATNQVRHPCRIKPIKANTNTRDSASLWNEIKTAICEVDPHWLTPRIERAELAEHRSGVFWLDSPDRDLLEEAIESYPEVFADAYRAVVYGQERKPCRCAALEAGHVNWDHKFAADFGLCEDDARIFA